jgi:NADH:ubiquinone oxidoreductase subunit 5 (subunit L)/multisubunit Na+/H+ antiporter MnhA subunit
MGGLAKKLPVTHMTYLVGTLAISGLFWTSGFWSKDMILDGALKYPVIYWTLSITAGLTAFYMFRTYFMTFTGNYRGEAHVHHESKVMVVPLAILAIPSIFIGGLLSGVSSQFPAFAEYIHPVGAVHELEKMGFLTPIGIRSMMFGFGGAILAYLFYGPKPILSADMVRKLAAPLYTLFSKKWFFDDLYQGFVDRVYLVFANASATFDRGVIDGLVNTAGKTVADSGYALRQLQTGKVQTYIAVIFFSVLVLSLFYIYWLL